MLKSAGPAPPWYPVIVSTVNQLVNAAREELGGFSGGAVLGRVVTALLPPGGAGRLRAQLLRLCGLAVGERTLIMAPLTVIGGRHSWGNLTIGPDCFINQGCVFDATALIEIGADVSLGHGVLITTSSHRIGEPRRRAGLLEPLPVTIGDGAWLGSRAVVLPGVRIGDGAIVAAGAVVNRDVPANTLAAGVPARVTRELPGPDGDTSAP